MKRILLPSFISSVVFLTVTTPSTAQNYTISTFAGGGTKTNEGISALSALVNQPYDVAFDAAGNVYIAQAGDGTVPKVTPGGVTTTVAGGNATVASFSPLSIALDAVTEIRDASSISKATASCRASRVLRPRDTP